MKTIECIIRLAEQAEKNANKRNSGGTGMAKMNRRERVFNWGGADYVGDMKEVYRVEYEKGGLSGDTVTLFHYGTKTAEVWLTHPEASVLHIYGESRSDADSVNTFLDYYDIKARYTFRPVNGGFMRIDMEGVGI